MYYLDELGEDLHNDLLYYYLNVFIFNSDKSQLIITSQETTLLSQDMINENRGVVWFVEKNKETASSEYARGDSFGLHKNLSLYNSYRIGRLGAKPELGSIFINLGPTEFFYFKSLCDVFKRITIKPDYPKHTNIKELDAKIAEGVAMGYSHIFCIIDMDTKDKEPERSQYQKLKAKYAKPIDKPKKGIYCEVEFFETHRCTELFFLYYFRYTSRPYDEQEPLFKDLNQCVEYRKTIEFFIKTKGLHGYFERNGGCLEKAMANANRSMDEKLKDGRDYTYSELGRLIDKLTALSEKH